MSKNETYLVLALIAWVAFSAGRSRGFAIGQANANTYPNYNTDWLNGWAAN